MITNILQIVLHLLVFSVPVVGVACGVEGILSLSVLFLAYILANGCALRLFQSSSELLCWVVQTALSVLFLITPIHLVPEWITTVYHVLMDKSVIISLGAETIALFQLISVISQGFVSSLDHETFGSVLTIVFLSIAATAFGVAAILFYLLVQAELGWFAIVIFTLGVVSLYFMYYKEEGNVLDASLLLLSSAAVLYLSLYETEFPTEADVPTESLALNRDEWRDSRVASLLWMSLANIPVSIRMWYRILNPLSMAYVMLRVMFVIFYLQWKRERDREQSDETDGIWRKLSSSTTVYHILLLIIISHMVCQHLLAVDASGSAPIKGKLWERSTEIFYTRFIQSILLQVLYIYSMYGTDDVE